MKRDTPILVHGSAGGSASRLGPYVSTAVVFGSPLLLTSTSHDRRSMPYKTELWTWATTIRVYRLLLSL